MREQCPEYEAKLTEAQERITSLEDKIRRQREALRVLNEAQARITSQLDLEAARRAAEMVQTLKHEPGKAAVELAVARERIAELEATNHRVRKYAERIRGMLPTNRGGMMDGDTREIIVTLDRIITILDGKEGGGGDEH